MEKKTIAMILAMMCVIGSFAGCASEKTPEETTLPVDVGYTDLGEAETTVPETTTAPETTVAETTTRKKSSKVNPNGDIKGDDIWIGDVTLVPDCEITHSGVDFGQITYGSKEYNLFEGDALALCQNANLSARRTSAENIIRSETNDFCFYGYDFTERKDTIYSIEVIEDDFVLLTSDSTEVNRTYYAEAKGLMVAVPDFADYKPTGMHLYGDLRVNAPRFEVEELLGEGIEGTPYTETRTNPKTDEVVTETCYPVYYKSETTTMVFIYEYSTFEYKGEFPQIARKIFVLKND